MAEKAIYSILSNDPTLQSLIGDRIFPFLLPEQVNYPAVSYQRISAPRLYTMKGTDGLVKSRFQVDVYANEYADIKAVGDALHQALSGLATTAAGVSILGIFETNDTDLFDAESRTLRNRREYEVHYLEA